MKKEHIYKIYKTIENNLSTHGHIQQVSKVTRAICEQNIKDLGLTQKEHSDAMINIQELIRENPNGKHKKVIEKYRKSKE